MASMFVRADEVANDLEISMPQAYRLIRKMNDELRADGFITIAGRVSRKFYSERFYGFGSATKGGTEHEHAKRESNEKAEHRHDPS